MKSFLLLKKFSFTFFFFVFLFIPFFAFPIHFCEKLYVFLLLLHTNAEQKKREQKIRIILYLSWVLLKPFLLYQQFFLYKVNTLRFTYIKLILYKKKLKTLYLQITQYRMYIYILHKVKNLLALSFSFRLKILFCHIHCFTSYIWKMY